MRVDVSVTGEVHFCLPNNWSGNFEIPLWAEIGVGSPIWTLWPIKGAATTLLGWLVLETMDVTRSTTAD